MKDKANCVHLGVGVDTARYAHHVSFLDEKKRTAAKAFHFTETAEGYRKFRQSTSRGPTGKATPSKAPNCG